MRTVISLLLLICAIGAITDAQLQDSLLSSLRTFSPYAGNVAEDRMNTQRRENEMEDFVHHLKKLRNESTTRDIPLRQPFKIMNPALANLVAKSEFYYNTAQRDHTHVPNTSPNEMMFMRQLQHSAKNANKALNKPRELPSNTSKRLSDLQSLVDQMDRITRVFFNCFIFIEFELSC